MFGAIRDINAQGTSVLLVEQNVAMAMQLATRAYVMEEGRIVAEGLAAICSRGRKSAGLT